MNRPFFFGASRRPSLGRAVLGLVMAAVPGFACDESQRESVRTDGTIEEDNDNTACQDCALLDTLGTPPPGFVAVPAGSYLRGGLRQHPLWRENVSPIHPVTISRPLWVQATPTTQGLFAEVMGRNPSYFVSCGADCPVERVSFFDALAFANAMSARDGLAPCYTLDACRGVAGGGCPRSRCLDDPICEDVIPVVECDGDFVCERIAFEGVHCEGYRLPTEAEQEYLIRAGTTSAWPVDGVPSDAALSEVALWWGNSFNDEWNDENECASEAADDDGEPLERFPCAPAPVGTRRANAFGLYDTIGLAYEWGWDHYDGAYASAAWQVDPIDTRGDGAIRVVRGGSFTTERAELLSFSRGRIGADLRTLVASIRLVRTAGQQGAVPECDGDWLPDVGCILGSAEPLPLAEAEAWCAARGATLTLPLNDRSNEWLSLRWSPPSGAPLHIGATWGDDGRARSRDGSPLPYARPRPGAAPAPGTCAGLNGDGLWTSEPCARPLPFACTQPR